jgi:hypothetical protein
MQEQVVFAGMPPPPERAAWHAWMAHHGINPSDVVVSTGGRPGWIRRDEERRQIVYLGFGRSPDGEIATQVREIDGDPPRSVLEAVTERRTVQLEAVPSPFPRPTGCVDGEASASQAPG